MFFLLFAIKSCNGGDGIYQGNEGVMENAMNGKYHMRSLDSLINADTLPMLDYWAVSAFRDYETSERLVRRIYMKDNTVYIVEDVNNDSVKINKRILTVEEDN